MPILRKRFPLQPAFRDQHQTYVPIVGKNEWIGPGGSGKQSSMTGGGDTVGHMKPPARANLAGTSQWGKGPSGGDNQLGLRPSKNKGKGWKSMSLDGPE